MKKLRLLILLPFLTIFSSCDTLRQFGELMEPSGPEMVAALRQALEVGTNNASTQLNRENGYLHNQLVMIAFPPEAQRAANTLRDLGMGKLVDDFVVSLNRAAENAAQEAAPIFVNAIREMTIEDARNIVLGSDTAATHYFRQKTYENLYNAFYPHVQQSLNQVDATRYWTDITSTYNQIPMVQRIDTDLARYTTIRALDGLFHVVSLEEKMIREDPSKRVTELLRRVFGWAATQQNQ